MAKAKTAEAASTDKYATGLFKAIVEKCEGCERIVEALDNKFCSTYIAPESKWKNGICNFATHVKPEIEVGKTKINPLKASKRAMGRKK